tara:strand:+ start:42 stop:803 length:762 start_codon:yes stop_codon:yes gene_type:complete
MKLKFLQAAAACLMLSVCNLANAGLILHVYTGGIEDHRAKGIDEILTADGHSVSSFIDNTSAFNALNGQLDNYDMIIWDNYSRSSSNEVTNVGNYVANGGALLATGYDSHFQSGMRELIGGVGATLRDHCCGTDNTPSAIINQANSVTVGMVDIRGLLPEFQSDLDAFSTLGSGLVSLSEVEFGSHLTLREHGLGEVAFLSTTYGHDYRNSPVYSGALRNFAMNNSQEVPEPSTLVIFAFGMMGLAVRRFKKQ